MLFEQFQTKRKSRKLLSFFGAKLLPHFEHRTRQKAILNSPELVLMRRLKLPFSVKCPSGQHCRLLLSLKIRFQLDKSTFP